VVLTPQEAIASARGNGKKSFAALNVKSATFSKRSGSQPFRAQTREESKTAVDPMKSKKFWNNEQGRYNSNFNIISKKLVNDTKLGNYAKRPNFVQKKADTSEIDEVNSKIKEKDVLKLAYMTFNLERHHGAAITKVNPKKAS
jgi:hypothetical protein